MSTNTLLHEITINIPINGRFELLSRKLIFYVEFPRNIESSHNYINYLFQIQKELKI